MVNDKYGILRGYLEEFADGNLSARELAEVILEDDQRWSKKTLMNGIYALKADPSLAKEPEDPEMVAETIKLAKQKQRAMDTNRIERKTVRDHIRKDNAIEELTKAFSDIVEEHKFDKVTL